MVNQAIADLGETARTFLYGVHAGDVADVRATANAHLRRLREYVRRTGIDLDTVPAWHDHITNWRAIARLAGSTITPAERTQAG
jgi:stage V sporulation protein SpoVS